jgi:hypothetical protein
MQNTMKQMKAKQGAQHEISIDGISPTYRDRQDIALQTARFLNDLQTGEETVVAFKSGSS